MKKTWQNLLLMLISILPLLVSDGILYLTGIADTVLGYIRILICCLTVVMYVLCRQKPSVPMVILGAVYATVFASALLHGVLKMAVLNFIGGLAMCLVFDFWLKRDREHFLKVCHVLLIALMLANLITILLYPEGMYKGSIYSNNYLLGHKNAHFEYIMTALVINVIQTYRKRGRIGLPSLCLMVAGCLSLYLVDSLMALFAVAAFSAAVLLLVNRSDRRGAGVALRLINLKTMIAATVLVFAGVILMHHSEPLLAWATKLSNALGRQTPFNGRVPIWDAAIELVGQSPLVGYGIVPPDRFVELSGIGGGTHAHNYILNVLIMGGAVCLLEHIGLFAVTVRRLDANRGFGSYVMSFAIGLYFFAGITNINFYSELFNPIFILAYYGAENCIAGTNGRIKRVYKWQ